MPEDKIINANAKFIHKVINDQKVDSLTNLTTSTNRITAKIHHKYPKKRLYWTPFEYQLQLFNKIPQDLKKLKNKTLKKKFKKQTIEFKPEL